MDAQAKHAIRALRHLAMAQTALAEVAAEFLFGSGARTSLLDAGAALGWAQIEIDGALAANKVAAETIEPASKTPKQETRP